MITVTKKITLYKLRNLHNLFECKKWRRFIKTLLSANCASRDNDVIEIPNWWIDAGTKKEFSEVQIKALADLNIILVNDKSINVTQSFIKEAVFMRGEGNLKGKAAFLSTFYNWEIKEDDMGTLCLIPTKK